MTSVPQRVSQAVAKTKRVWMVCMALLVTAFVFSQFPAWNAIFLVPIGIITYFAAITLTIIAASNNQAQSMDHQADDNPLLIQLQADLKAGLVKPGSEEMFQRMRECGIMEILPIGRVSEHEIVGSFNGHTIYEWVEIQDPFSGQMEKFTYFSPGSYEKDGTPIMPDDDQQVFAHVNGIVYSRAE